MKVKCKVECRKGEVQGGVQARLGEQQRTKTRLGRQRPGADIFGRVPRAFRQIGPPAPDISRTVTGYWLQEGPWGPGWSQPLTYPGAGSGADLAATSQPFGWPFSTNVCFFTIFPTSIFCIKFSTPFFRICMDFGILGVSFWHSFGITFQSFRHHFSQHRFCMVFNRFFTTSYMPQTTFYIILSIVSCVFSFYEQI